MRYLLLFFRMLRYRVAITLLLFFFLGIAKHEELIYFHFTYIYAIAALLASYVVATTTNDIADVSIDRINHAKHKGRPLVTGEATVGNLRLLQAVASLLAIISGLLISFSAFLLVLSSLAINVVYSVKPIRISYRTHFAPVLLAIAYVILPYLLGLVAIGSAPRADDWIFLTSLFFLFIGRILLKDFRDRKGDKKYSKPTFLLSYGKRATCSASFLSVALGSVLFYFALSFSTTIALLFALFFLGIFFTGYRLYKAETGLSEQAAIGTGAKLGNGLLITLLGYFILHSYHATESTLTAFVTLLTVAYFISFVMILKNPTSAISGYKG